MKLSGEEKVFKRQVYTFLDMISDIGGLNDGLIIITGFFLSAYNAAKFESAMTSSLFLFRNTPSKHQKSEIGEVTNEDVR